MACRTRLYAEWRNCLWQRYPLEDPPLYMRVDHGCVRSHYFLLSLNGLHLSITCRCDSINPDGSEKPPTEYRRAYTHAMKMRSALTYGFGRLYSRGNSPWACRDGIRWDGNPSVSPQVARYMVALRKRKVRLLSLAHVFIDTACLLA